MMNTVEIGHRLAHAPKTVRRLCAEGKIDATKVGNEWRTTAERLAESRYLRHRRVREGYESP